MNNRILIIEDEKYLVEIITDYFETEGFKVLSAYDGIDALKIFEREEVDLILLDIMLPNLNGFEICKTIRKNSNIPIIMITARSEEDDKLQGFELGADEYVTKPFSPKVLVARTKNLLKRINGNIDKKFEKCGIFIDFEGHSVKIDSKIIELSKKEYDLLVYLIKNENRVLSREQILSKVWGYDFFGDERVVDTHIKKLRKKMGQKGEYIKTVIRVGYKFEVMDNEK